MEEKKDWKKLCNKCGARCCQYVAIEIDKPTCKKDYDNIRWHLMHRDVTVFIDQDNKWTLQFEGKCENLNSDNSCKIYSTRPKVCSEYPGENYCEYEGDEPPYKVLFRNAGEYEQYLTKKKINWKWKK